MQYNNILRNIVSKVAITAAILNTLFIILLISFRWAKFLPYLFIGTGVMAFNYTCLYWVLKKYFPRKRRIFYTILGFFLRWSILVSVLGIILHYNIYAFLIAAAATMTIPLSFIIVGIVSQPWKGTGYFYLNF